MVDVAVFPGIVTCTRIHGLAQFCSFASHLAVCYVSPRCYLHLMRPPYTKCVVVVIIIVVSLEPPQHLGKNRQWDAGLARKTPRQTLANHDGYLNALFGYVIAQARHTRTFV